MNVNNHTTSRREAGLFEHGIPTGLSQALVLFVLFASPLLVGTVHPVTIMAMSVTAQAGLAVDLWNRTKHGRSTLVLGKIGAVMSLILFWTLLQAIPMPKVLLELLSPRAVEIRDYVLKGTTEWSFAPITLDLPATLLDAVRQAGLLCVFLVAMNRIASRKARLTRMHKTLVVSAAVVSALGLLQKLFGTTSILGVYEHPNVKQSFFTATFVNPNHLAGYMALIAPIGVGMAVEAEDRSRKVIFALGAGLAMLAAFFSLSRGGMLAILVGQILLVVLLWIRRAKKKTQVKVVLVITMLAISAASWVAYRELTKELETMDTVQEITADNKVQSWKPLFPMIEDFWLTGAGRGAYSTVYTLYKELPNRTTFTHAENEALQALVDFGLPLGSILVVTFAAILIGLLGSPGLKPSMCGVLAGLWACSMHNMVDFNLETGAVGLSFAAMLGGIYGRVSRTKSRNRNWYANLTNISAARTLKLLPAVTLITITTGTWAGLHTMSMDTFALTAAADSDGYETAKGIGATLLQRRPSDYYAAYILARSALDQKQIRDAMHWVNRAQYLNPTAFEPHELAAYILMRLKRHGQAMLEFKLAAQKAGPKLGEVLTRAFGIYPSHKSWFDMTPDTRDARIFLAHALMADRDAASALEALEPLLANRDFDVLMLASRAAKASGDMRTALDHARAASFIQPDRVEPYAMMAELAPRPEEAVQILIDALSKVENKRAIWYKLAHLYLKKGDLDAAYDSAERMAKSAHGSTGAVAASKWLQGMIENRRGNKNMALHLIGEAVDIAPRNQGYRFKLASMLESMDRLGQAKRHLEVLVSQHPENKAYKKALDRVEKKIKSSTRDIENLLDNGLE